MILHAESDVLATSPIHGKSYAYPDVSFHGYDPPTARKSLALDSRRFDSLAPHSPT